MSLKLDQLGKLQSNILQSPALQQQCESLDWQELERAIAACIHSKESLDDSEPYAPASFYPLEPKTDGQQKLYADATALGLEILTSGKVAIFMVAGGQGSRLGFTGPKGMLPVSIVKQKTLFQLFAERIKGLELKYQTTLPWYIMCSPLNKEATIEFFKEQQYFGLNPDHVMFFTQGMMPATDFEGNLILSSVDSLAFSPNGHGGAIAALNQSGAISDMRERGIDHLSFFQVDNPLSSLVDPLFIGLHAMQDSDMSCRSLTKTNPFEKLGNFVCSEDRTFIIEYSDLPEKKALEVDEDDQMKYKAGSPGIYLFRRDFIEQFAHSTLELPYHRAEKKVPCLDDHRTLVIPTEVNAVKFETFIFDALLLARNPVILEANRHEEFSPIKNKTGVDSLESAQEDMNKKSHQWLNELGIDPPVNTLIELSAESFPTRDELALATLPNLDAESHYYLE